MESINKTNAGFRQNTYGEWYFAISSGGQKDGVWLDNAPWVEKTGISRNFGIVTGANRETGFGVVDDTLKEMGRLRLNDGVWPTRSNEIAMEADILGLLGFDYTLGQKITLEIAVPCGEASIYVEQTFILCGIIHEYTDLWVLNQNQNSILLNGAVVTEEAANHLLEMAQFILEESGEKQIIKVDKAIPQYFVNVSEENREEGLIELQKYMRDSSRGENVDKLPCINTAAYKETNEKSSAVGENVAIAMNHFYVYAIAAVMMLAVLCIYIMQLSSEVHSFAVLRSIGITKGQMAQLLIIETMLLSLPAILLGIPLGMGLTWLALNIALYAGSVSVQVVIPSTEMLLAIFLWVVMILFSRLLVFALIVRTPLSGSMQLQKRKLRWAKAVRGVFIVLLLSVFSTITIFTSLKVLSPKNKMAYWASESPYNVWVSQGNSDFLTQAHLDLIEQIPGISNAVGFNSMQIAIAFDGSGN